MKMNLQQFQSDCVDAFTMEFSQEDIRSNPEVKKLAKYINKQGRKIDRITQLQRKVLGY
jgi:hypothetical protein